MTLPDKRRVLKVAERVATVVSWLVIAAAGLFALYVVGISCVYSAFTIPSDSMQPGIIPGDKVIVDKIVTGARFFSITKAARGERVNVRRSPRLRALKRGDVIVFNFVHRGSWDSIAMDWKKYYIKRCIAMPGDSLSISGFRYIVNGDTLGGYPGPEVFERYYPADSAGRADRVRGYMVDLSDSIDCWTVRDFGPLLIPEKGMTVAIDSTNLHRYRQIIEWESGKRAQLTAAGPTLGGEPLRQYTFAGNYYFATGDNAVASLDSRYWGLVPEDFIVGRAAFICWSERNGKIKWNRIFKRIR